MPPTHNILLYKGKIYIQGRGEPKPSIRKKKKQKQKKQPKREGDIQPNVFKPNHTPVWTTLKTWRSTKIGKLPKNRCEPLKPVNRSRFLIIVGIYLSSQKPVFFLSEKSFILVYVNGDEENNNNKNLIDNIRGRRITKNKHYRKRKKYEEIQKVEE